MKRLGNPVGSDVAYLLMWAFLIAEATDDDADDTPDEDDDPDDTVPEHTEIKYQFALGGFAMSWGEMEATLDFLVASIFRSHDMSPLFKEGVGPVKKGVGPDIPRSLEKRLDFIKEAARKLPSLASAKAELQSVCTALNRLKDRRNTLVHGVLIGYRPDGGATLFQVKYKGREHLFEEHGVDPGDLDTLKDQTDAIRTRLVKAVSSVVPARFDFVEDHPGEA